PPNRHCPRSASSTMRRGAGSASAKAGTTPTASQAASTQGLSRRRRSMITAIGNSFIVQHPQRKTYVVNSIRARPAARDRGNPRKDPDRRDRDRGGGHYARSDRDLRRS